MNPSVTATRSQSDFWNGFWRLAALKFSLTSLASIYLAAGAVSLVQPVDLAWLLATGFVIFMLEIAKNASGDVYDYDSGTDLRIRPEDKTDFSGGRRVLVDDLLSRRETWMISVGTALAGLVVGLAIVFWREPAALWFGVAGAVFAWSYHGPPLKLAYRGGGELAVFVSYGPLIAVATYLIQTHTLSGPVLWLSVPLGLMVAAFLWVNEFPDHDADRASGKRNLIVRLGKRSAALLLPVIYGAAFVITLALPAIGFPSSVLWGMLSVVPAAYACWAVLRDPETFYRTKPVQPAALVAFMLYAVGAGTGLFLS